MFPFKLKTLIMRFPFFYINYFDCIFRLFTMFTLPLIWNNIVLPSKYYLTCPRPRLLDVQFIFIAFMWNWIPVTPQFLSLLTNWILHTLVSGLGHIKIASHKWFYLFGFTFSKCKRRGYLQLDSEFSQTFCSHLDNLNRISHLWVYWVPL